MMSACDMTNSSTTSRSYAAQQVLAVAGDSIWITGRQYARLLGMSPQTFANRMASGTLDVAPVTYHGRLRRWLVDDVVSWAETRRATFAAKTTTTVE